MNRRPPAPHAGAIPGYATSRIIPINRSDDPKLVFSGIIFGGAKIIIIDKK